MDKVKIRFGGYQGPNSVHTRAGHRFGEALAEEFGASVDFHFDANIVARGQKASDLLTMVEAGELEGCYFSSSYLAHRVPELGIFDQHFVVPDRRRAYAVLDGALGKRLAELVEANTGFTVMDYWDNGFRHISNGLRPITRPEDCRGMKIRTLANDNHQRVFRALGFEPKTIDVRDLPEAVVTGVVDAQENPLTNIYNFGLHSTHRFITKTCHLMGVATILFNKQAVHSWPARTRQGIAQALRSATTAQRRFADEDDRICAGKLIAEGATILELEPEQRQAFVAATSGEVAKTRTGFGEALISLFDEDLSQA
ncbi:MAG: TRAP transporter substrate-binding protein [Halocynthiibacter sp.]